MVGSAEMTTYESVAADIPRSLRPGRSLDDKLFRGTAIGIGVFVLVTVGAIGAFLGLKLIPTIHQYGWGFFTRSDWNPGRNVIGIAAAIFGTIEVAVIALAIAFPLALCTALFVSEYAPNWAKATLVSLIDLMAAVPSIVYGAWGVNVLMGQTIGLSRWLNQHLGWLPFMRVDGGHANSALWNQHLFFYSPFVAGITVAMMVIPVACAVMRNVFALAPIGEREAAYALGATRWGMIRSVVLPFGRAGIIGGTMLGLGRALGETVAVLLILSQSFDIRAEPLHIGGVTLSSVVANFFGEATSAQLSALLAAGFVLFLMTLVVNTFAAIIVTRSRSGAATEI